jgi:hypothetical protein
MGSAKLRAHGIPRWMLSWCHLGLHGACSSSGVNVWQGNFSAALYLRRQPRHHRSMHRCNRLVQAGHGRSLSDEWPGIALSISWDQGEPGALPLITLKQSVFATKVLEKPRMGDCNRVHVPMKPHLKLIKESKNLLVSMSRSTATSLTTSATSYTHSLTY